MYITFLKMFFVRLIINRVKVSNNNIIWYILYKYINIIFMYSANVILFLLYYQTNFSNP